MIDKDLFRLLGKNKKYIFIVVGLMFLGLIFNLCFTATIAWAIYLVLQDHELLRQGGSIDYLHYVYPTISAAIALILRYIVSRVIGDLKDCLGRRVKKDLRERIYDKILALGVRSADSMSMAGLTQVSMEGIEQLDLYYCEYIPQFFYAMIAPFVLFGITVGFMWRPAVALICFVPLIPASIIMVSKYAKKVFAKYWGIYTSMGDSFLDSTQGLNELKIFKADARRNEVMNAHAEEFRRITMKVLIMQLASTTIMDTVAYGGAGLGIALALISLKNGYIAYSYEVNIALTIFMILVAVDFFLPMRRFGSAFHVGMNGASAGRKILSLLNTEESIWKDGAVAGTDIHLKNVTFSYDSKRDVLKDVSLDFDEKGMFAIVGESGSGKSTIVNLITGANRINIGEIHVGDKSLYDLSRVSYYSHLGVVSYNTYIFNESIRDNFKLAKANVTDEEIYNALRQTDLYDFIMNEAGGLDKIILEDANNISGGERQRLALAINLVSNKDIYIFDEATSNIDIESEAIIMKNIKALSKEKSVIVISHRLENVVPADKIYFLDEGIVKEVGSHEELIKLNGGYAKLYQTQKSLEEGFKEVA